MSESIIPEDSEEYCFIHMKYLGVVVRPDHVHHCIHGVANRRIADREGLTVHLCERCHTALHDKGYHDLDLQQIAEQAWMEYNKKAIEEWIALFGKNYLE